MGELIESLVTGVSPHFDSLLFKSDVNLFDLNIANEIHSGKEWYASADELRIDLVLFALNMVLQGLEDNQDKLGKVLLPGFTTEPGVPSAGRASVLQGAPSSRHAPVPQCVLPLASWRQLLASKSLLSPSSFQASGQHYEFAS